jgi:hypothetical protein
VTAEETRTRFLAAIAAQLPADRVMEVHLFGAIRQGGTESGVAVIAVDANEGVMDANDDVADANEDAPDDSPYAEPSQSPQPPRRYVVYTARYRHTLKGIDRGKWESSVTEEADAPLVTVDAVVRGVSRRSGDADETVRLSGDEFRAALPEVAARP